MDAVFGLSLLLLLMLLNVSHGVKGPCDGRQNGAKCYGALGGTVLLQLMDDASNIERYQWKTESTIILNGRKGRPINDLKDNRFSFTLNNGTFRIDNLRRGDGGEYTLLIYSDGVLKVTRTLQLLIQAPVSSVQLVFECLSQGEMRVTCSSGEGDSPQYSWTLNGQKLKESQLFSGNHETKNITLKQDVSGRLVCTVKNQVNSVQEGKTFSTCGFKLFDCTLTNGTYINQWLRPTNETLCVESTTTPEGKETDITVTNKPSYKISTTNSTEITPSGSYPWYIRYLPIMGGVLFVMLVLLAVGVGVVYAQKKRQNKPKEDVDEQELTYADIKVVPRHGRQMQRAEREVEYGQVKFAQRPRPPVEPSGDECVYSMVRKGR